MTIEYQHVTGAWMITDYDSRDDPDALPEQKTLKGRVVFQAQFDPQDRSHAIHVPDDAGAYLLSVREMTFAIVRGRLQDRQARDGVMLPAVVGSVPIVWTAVPELQEDPGVGVDGAPVAANPITFNPADPDSEGVRRVNLADVVDPSIVLPELVESRVAQLVREATEARDESLQLEESATAAAEYAGRRADDAHQSAIDAADAAASQLATKRDVVSGAHQVYTTDGGSEQSHLGYSSGATPSTIMSRDASGRTKVADPADSADAANKGYVDTELAGKADLDGNGQIVQAQIPAVAMTAHLGVVASEAAMLALVGERGDWCIRTDTGTVWVVTTEPSSQLASWVEWVYPTSPVQSVNGRTGAVTTSSTDITDASPTGRAIMVGSQWHGRDALSVYSKADSREMFAPKLVDRGAFSASSDYEPGDVVTYSQGRWCCTTAVAAGAWSAAAWIHLGKDDAAVQTHGGRAVTVYRCTQAEYDALASGVKTDPAFVAVII